MLVVDFGAQYAQLIARRVREAHVYSEIVPHDTSVDEILARRPAAVILSGGPASVADAGSLTHAGDVLHLSQSAVSRQVRALEEMLGTTLFHRHARGLALTNEGEQLRSTTMRMAEEIERYGIGDEGRFAWEKVDDRGEVQRHNRQLWLKMPESGFAVHLDGTKGKDAATLDVLLKEFGVTGEPEELGALKAPGPMPF